MSSVHTNIDLHHSHTRRSSNAIQGAAAPYLRVGLARGVIPVDHFEWNTLVSRIESHLNRADAGPSLTISSVNLDHLHHYRRQGPPGHPPADSCEWLYIADGWPVAWRAAKVSGRQWPRLAGSDLLPEIMRMLDVRRGSIAVVGGTPDMHERLRSTADDVYPNVVIKGMWAPARDELVAEEKDTPLERGLADLDPDVVLVSLPKPLSENWISQHASDGSGRLYLPFGAAADFLSGHIKRAPAFMQRFGMEWLYRLMLEPRRMARRYLIQAPKTLRILMAPTVIEKLAALEA